MQVHRRIGIPYHLLSSYLIAFTVTSTLASATPIEEQIARFLRPPYDLEFRNTIEALSIYVHRHRGKAATPESTAMIIDLYERTHIQYPGQTKFGGNNFDQICELQEAIENMLVETAAFDDKTFAYLAGFSARDPKSRDFFNEFFFEKLLNQSFTDEQLMRLVQTPESATALVAMTIALKNGLFNETRKRVQLAYALKWMVLAKDFNFELLFNLNMFLSILKASRVDLSLNLEFWRSVLKEAATELDRFETYVNREKFLIDLQHESGDYDSIITFWLKTFIFYHNAKIYQSAQDARTLATVVGGMQLRLDAAIATFRRQVIARGLRHDDDCDDYF